MLMYASLRAKLPNTVWVIMLQHHCVAHISSRGVDNTISHSGAKCYTLEVFLFFNPITRSLHTCACWRHQSLYKSGHCLQCEYSCFGSGRTVRVYIWMWGIMIEFTWSKLSFLYVSFGKMPLSDLISTSKVISCSMHWVCVYTCCRFEEKIFILASSVI